MSCWALVPVKARVDCKTRLAQVLSPHRRLALVRQVLSHVLATLQQIPRIDHIAVVSPERDQVPGSIELLPEQGTDLNSSLTRAIASARSRGATMILVLHADLPHVDVTDVEALLDGALATGIALAPDELCEGTNGVCFPAELDFRLQFGVNSFQAHYASAQALKWQPAVVRTPGLGFDLDTSADLKKFADRLESICERNRGDVRATRHGVYQ